MNRSLMCVMQRTETRKGRHPMKPLLLACAGVLLVAAAASAVEVALVKASEYRLSHGDGRERTFRRGKDGGGGVA